MSWSFKRCALAAALFACTLAGWGARNVQAQQSRSVNQGIYTDEQAKRGAVIYKDRCASCHGDALGGALGGALGPPLAGNDFIGVWDKEPLSALFNKIRNTMPQNEPGKLTSQQTADL